MNIEFMLQSVRAAVISIVTHFLLVSTAPTVSITPIHFGNEKSAFE